MGKSGNTYYRRIGIIGARCCMALFFATALVALVSGFSEQYGRVALEWRLWRNYNGHSSCSMDAQADAMEEILTARELPGDIGWIPSSDGNGLSWRQDRMAAGYFLCPRPLPLMDTGNTHKPEWLLAGGGVEDVLKSTGLKPYYELAETRDGCAWLYHRRLTPVTEEDERNAEEDQEEKVGWKPEGVAK